MRTDSIVEARIPPRIHPYALPRGLQVSPVDRYLISSLGRRPVRCTEPSPLLKSPRPHTRCNCFYF